MRHLIDSGRILDRRRSKNQMHSLGHNEEAFAGMWGMLKYRSRRVFGGQFGEKGSVLVYVLVLFGMASMLLASAMSAEGSALTLNVKTGHRRKALDLARGAVDEMHLLFVSNGFNLASLGDVTHSDPDGEWSAKATIEQDGDSVLICGEATVRDVTEVINVWLEPEYEEGGVFPGCGHDDGR